MEIFYMLIGKEEDSKSVWASKKEFVEFNLLALLPYTTVFT